jgi:hypothetical protein
MIQGTEIRANSPTGSRAFAYARSDHGPASNLADETEFSGRTIDTGHRNRPPGLASWAGIGLLTTVPLGTIYGWSGHPAMPDAPFSVYVLVYLLALPALCFGGSWKLTSWATRFLDPT